MDIKELEERIKLLEKELVLCREILELKKEIHGLNKNVRPPYYPELPYWQPWCDGTGTGDPRPFVNIC